MINDETDRVSQEKNSNSTLSNRNKFAKKMENY